MQGPLGPRENGTDAVTPSSTRDRHARAKEIGGRTSQRNQDLWLQVILGQQSLTEETVWLQMQQVEAEQALLTNTDRRTDLEASLESFACKATLA